MVDQCDRHLINTYLAKLLTPQLLPPAPGEAPALELSPGFRCGLLHCEHLLLASCPAGLAPTHPSGSV